MRPRNNRPRHAFTLLELMAVVVMIGLIAAVSMISVRGHLDRVQLVRLSQAIADADRKERDAARQSPLPSGLTIDRRQNRLRFIRSGKTVSLDQHLRVNVPLVMPSSGRSGTIPFTQSGQSSTYALQLQNPRGAIRWVVIVGTTGQAWFSDEADSVQALVAMEQSR